MCTNLLFVLSQEVLFFPAMKPDEGGPTEQSGPGANPGEKETNS